MIVSYGFSSLKHLRSSVRCFSTTMAKSKYEYVKAFERDDRIMPQVFIVVRIDGKGFHRFSKVHDFAKPNDERALNLMNKAAFSVMEEFNDIVLAYGQSDEYSFVFRPEADVYQRRESKITSNVVSLFTSTYVCNWSNFFGSGVPQYPPAFDARAIVYPTAKILRDYLSWRQTDCHINNLHNTCFWKLVQEGGMSPNDAQKKLQTMLAADKQEMLFSQFQTNYNNLPQLFRKGTVIVKEPVEENSETRDKADDSSTTQQTEENSSSRRKDSNKSKKKKIMKPVALHVAMYENEFWTTRPHILGNH